MIDLRKIEYRVVCITPEGEQLDLTPICTDLGWEEGAKELAVRTSLKIYNGQYGNKYFSESVQPGTPIYVYAIINGSAQEVARGFVEKWTPTFTNGRTAIDIEAYDEMHALRHNQDDKFYNDDTGTKAIITNILDSWSMPYDYQGPDIKHAKTVFRKKYLCDMITNILDEAKKKDKGFYFARAKEGVVQIIPRGTNEDIYHFDALDSAVRATDSFDSTNMITRVVIRGKDDEDGKQKVEATINGKTEFGVRQAIIDRPKDKSLDDATKTADEMLKEKGQLARKTTLEAPDLPFLRKGDRIRVRAGTVQGYFFVKSIRHNADDRKMTMEIDEDKERNEEIDTNSMDEGSDG